MRHKVSGKSKINTHKIRKGAKLERSPKTMRPSSPAHHNTKWQTDENAAWGLGAVLAGRCTVSCVHFLLAAWDLLDSETSRMDAGRVGCWGGCSTPICKSPLAPAPPNAAHLQCNRATVSLLRGSTSTNIAGQVVYNSVFCTCVWWKQNCKIKTTCSKKPKMLCTTKTALTWNRIFYMLTERWANSCHLIVCSLKGQC